MLYIDWITAVMTPGEAAAIVAAVLVVVSVIALLGI